MSGIFCFKGLQAAIKKNIKAIKGTLFTIHYTLFTMIGASTALTNPSAEISFS